MEYPARPRALRMLQCPMRSPSIEYLPCSASTGNWAVVHLHDRWARRPVLARLDVVARAGHTSPAGPAPRPPSGLPGAAIAATGPALTKITASPAKVARRIAAARTFSGRPRVTGSLAVLVNGPCSSRRGNGLSPAGWWAFEGFSMLTVPPRWRRWTQYRWWISDAPWSPRRGSGGRRPATHRACRAARRRRVG